MTDLAPGQSRGAERPYKRPRTVILTRQASVESSRILLGHRASSRDYDEVFEDEDVKIYNGSGALIAYILSGALGKTQSIQAYKPLHALRSRVSDNRGRYAGAPPEEYLEQGREVMRRTEGTRAIYVTSDGRREKATRGMKVRSSIIGYYDRTPRHPFCRETQYTRDDPGWEDVLPMAQSVSKAFEERLPKRFRIQMEAAQKTHPSWVIPRTPFTTLTVNNCVAGAYHTDKGDYEPGFGCMTYLRRGKYTGGLLVFPRYRIAINTNNRDIVLFNPHEIHGVTNYVGEGPEGMPELGGWERISVVLYFRTKMLDCGSPKEEVARARERADKLANRPEWRGDAED